jgi:hypothetical protein
MTRVPVGVLAGNRSRVLLLVLLLVLGCVVFASPSSPRPRHLGQAVTDESSVHTPSARIPGAARSPAFVGSLSDHV